MKPFSKILVPVDFSPHSTEAIRYAADLSRHRDASLTLTQLYHGRTGLRHARLGSVAENVVRNASCPVLTARAPREK